mgnify:CR=1 FL=1
MQKLLAKTYLMDIKGVEKELNRLWDKYQKIMKKPTWKSMNEARAILYLTGQVYCEKIAVEAIERRLNELKEPIKLLEFFTLIDKKDKKLKELRKDKKFKTLEQFYLAIKKMKNKFVGGKFYLDEEKFIEIYNKHNPNRIKLGYRGKFDK